MSLLLRWSKNSNLHGEWYSFAVELIGETNTAIIENTHYGGGNRSCLERMLIIWYNAGGHNWQTIIDALTEMDEFAVIDNIEKECLSYM